MFGQLIEAVRIEAKSLRSVDRPKGRSNTAEKIRRYRGLTKMSGGVDKSDGRWVDKDIHDKASEGSGRGSGYGGPGKPNVGADEIRAMRRKARG